MQQCLLETVALESNMGPTGSPTLAALFSWYMDGSSAALPAAHLVAPMSSARALATSFTALIRTTYTEHTYHQLIKDTTWGRVHPRLGTSIGPPK